MPSIERLFASGTSATADRLAARGREDRPGGRIARDSFPALELCSAPMRELFVRAQSARPRWDRRRGVPRTLVLAALVAVSGLACGEEVLVGRWVLRSSPADAGVEADASAADNPQSINAERARERERDRENAKPGPHDADKRH